MGAVATNIVEVTGNEPAPRNPAIDFIDEDLLRRIANETGGKYFRARDKDALRLIYNQIDKLETSLIEVTNYKRYEEKFLPFVLVALGLLLLEIGMRFTVFRRYP
jgi:Ca-activated chloride channel family protein